MSLSDEFKAAKRRMLAMQEAEKKKAKAPAKRGSRQATEWSKESEIVAYYLYKADSSKFLKENYSKKRNVSVRAMSMKINMFQELERGGKPKSVSPHAQTIISEYGHFPVDQLLKVVVSIHRGEFTGQPPKLELEEEETAPEHETVIKR
ncbi:hypothetical protein [Pseudobacteriovorax antillogorgiicola]|uniref:Uncharacterized protein n=1 Tax=Pseudobacteriovorax antillogorgiicola TaxID=1513793 RepID=A0A1Y6CEG8_9BACT|nr:hypothetical protein [Pseudobacteriovorax antillogorgiicola]TCS48015.1 hypothetical protein EDD56_119126 [Pseudobacteriovorax antillogorgiicola]SMF58572.1 hypothetical protein SAMN06296036_119127 [Pseudobacteriovorax antillogorgiicola]